MVQLCVFTCIFGTHTTQLCIWIGYATAENVFPIKCFIHITSEGFVKIKVISVSNRYDTPFRETDIQMKKNII
jgi:hypothetical protein